MLVRFSVFLHFCVYATDPPLHDLIIICLCYSASSTSFTYTAGLWSWHEGWWWLLLLITEPRWDLICRLSAWHPLTKVSDELFIFLLVTLICFCCSSLLRNKNVELTLNLWLRAMQHYYYPLNNSKQPNSREGDLTTANMSRPSVRLHPELPDSTTAVVAGRMKELRLFPKTQDRREFTNLWKPLMDYNIRIILIITLILTDYKSVLIHAAESVCDFWIVSF